jgi:phage repressor protein C with HTH and peptisase S24 domain/transcriptional regulator with XRE-family HTH domain
MKTFAEFAKDRVRFLGKSQKELANLLDVSPAYISQVLTGKKHPPDLSKARTSEGLRAWAEFLEVSEDEILERIKCELHGVTPRPSPRFPAMRGVLLRCLHDREGELADEIRSVAYHPAEKLAVQALVQIHMVMQRQSGEDRGYDAARFRENCARAKANKTYVESDLVRFLENCSIWWTWDPEGSGVRVFSDAAEIQEAMRRIDQITGQTLGLAFGRTVPVVGHVSAGRGFQFTDGGYPAGEGFDQVELPPGVDPSLAEVLYCVRIRGNSLREFINEGALLFIKPESWEEIKDGDLVIFKDRGENRAFVKKVEFAGDNLILKSMNPMYKNIVLRRADLCLLERVMSIIL